MHNATGNGVTTSLSGSTNVHQLIILGLFVLILNPVVQVSTRLSTLWVPTGYRAGGDLHVPLLASRVVVTPTLMYPSKNTYQKLD
jgi:hypothetical protein